MTQHPTEEWMQQAARNLTDADGGALGGQRYLLHDRDTKFCDRFRSILRAGGVEPLRLPASSPNLNAFAKRWVRTVKEECLSKLVLFRGDVAETSFDGVHRVRPQRTEPSREGKCPTLSFAR